MNGLAILMAKLRARRAGPSQRMQQLQEAHPNTLRTVAWARGAAVDRFAVAEEPGKLRALPIDAAGRLAACEVVLDGEYSNGPR